jgi:acid phosphatase
MGLRGFAIAGLLGLVCVAASYATAPRPVGAQYHPPSHIDRVVIIVLENYRSHHFTPFLSKLARENHFATNHFGVWRPRLPNYIAMIAGDFFGVNDDAESCYNSEHQEPAAALMRPIS